MKNLLLAMIIAAAPLLTAGCVTRVIVDGQPPAADKQPPGAGDARPDPAVAYPQISPDVNFKASNTMPGEPSL